MPEGKWPALMRSYHPTYEYSKYVLFRHKPDLSYKPEKPRLKPEEANFMIWTYCYVQPGKEREFEEICKDLVALYKRNNIPEEIHGYAGDIGTDMPLYLWTGRAKSAIDFYSQDEKEQEIFGKEHSMLWNKALSTLRKFEFKTGWFRPDLSYIPKEK
jgi:hypothetical protein